MGRGGQPHQKCIFLWFFALFSSGQRGGCLLTSGGGSKLFIALWLRSRPFPPTLVRCASISFGRQAGPPLPHPGTNSLSHGSRPPTMPAASPLFPLGTWLCGQCQGEPTEHASHRQGCRAPPDLSEHGWRVCCHWAPAVLQPQMACGGKDDGVTYDGSPSASRVDAHLCFRIQMFKRFPPPCVNGPSPSRVLVVVASHSSPGRVGVAPSPFPRMVITIFTEFHVALKKKSNASFCFPYSKMVLKIDLEQIFNVSRILDFSGFPGCF